MASQPAPPRLGARFTLTKSIERYPHFTAPVAATGTIVEAQPDLIGLHLDRYLPGDEAWNNDVVFTPEDDCDETGEPAARPRAVAAFLRHAEPLTESAIPASAQTPAEAEAEHFERDPHEGVRLALRPPGTGRFGVEVHLRGEALGHVCYHAPQPGATGLARCAYWYALTRAERYVNRVGDPAGVELGEVATTGQSSREQALGLLLAADTADLR